MINILSFSPIERFELYTIISYIGLTNISFTLLLMSTWYFLLFYYWPFSVTLLSGSMYYRVITLLHRSMLGFIESSVQGRFSVWLKYRYFYFLCLFIFLILTNFIGVLAYAPSISTQFIGGVFFAFLPFMGSIVLGFVEHKRGFFLQFLPLGIPIAIFPLMILIEIMSFIFKPISVSGRIFANLTGGAILLKGSQCIAYASIFQYSLIFPLSFIYLPGILGTFFFMLFLYAFELMCAIVQAYIFTLLVANFYIRAFDTH